jgi:dCTP deaminase
MSRLSDNGIALEVTLSNIIIEPFNDAQLQPSSYDVRCGDTLKRQDGTVIHPGLLADDTMGWVIRPGQFVLSSTVEWVAVNNEFEAEVWLRSTGARSGLVTTGHIDPGFMGHVTLEFINAGDEAFILRPGDSICQLKFNRLESPSTGYKGRYQNQGPQPEPARKL